MTRLGDGDRERDDRVMTAVRAAEALIAAVVRPEGLDPDELADIVNSLGLPDDGVGALTGSLGRARDEVSGLRRRSRELVAVAESARRLANATSVDETLDHLVRAAHGLVVADLAYLSEYYPETAELKVRATRGVTRSDFAALPVPTGIGLASRIAQTRRPQAVVDYFDEDGLTRSETMDAVVRDEGVVSLLGVPLVANSTVLGVLFVGTRSRHEYSADEVAVLSALADHAAIALLRALRFGDLERSGDEAVAEAAAWEQYFRDQRRVLDVVDELFDAVLSGEDIHEVIAALAEAVARGLVVVDEAGEVIAASGSQAFDGGASTSLPPPVAGARFVATPDSVETEAVVTVNTHTAGVLRLHVLRAPHGSPLLNPETVVRGAQVCAFAHLLATASRLREDRHRDRLLAALLSGTGTSPAATANQMAAAGLPLAEARHLIVVRGAAPDLRGVAASLHARSASRLRGVVFGMHAGELCALTDDRSAQPVLAILDRRTAEVADLTAIHATLVDEPVSSSEAAASPAMAPRADPSRPSESRSDTDTDSRREVTVLADVRRAHRAAADLLAVVEALEWSGHVVEAAELQPYATLFGTDRRALDAFVEAVIGPLVDTDDLPLLEAYFRSGRNLRATAEATSFHVNTVAQRLRRVDGLLGPSWRSPDRAFLTEAAVRLVSLDRRLRAPGV